MSFLCLSSDNILLYKLYRFTGNWSKCILYTRLMMFTWFHFRIMSMKTTQKYASWFFVFSCQIKILYENHVSHFSLYLPMIEIWNVKFMVSFFHVIFPAQKWVGGLNNESVSFMIGMSFFNPSWYRGRIEPKTWTFASLVRYKVQASRKVKAP